MPTSRPPHLSARNAARFALAALVLALIVAIAFETGQTPIEYALGYALPTALLLSIPLVYIATSLNKQPSRRALALGIAYPAVILITLWLSLSAKYASGSEGAMDVVFSFMFFWANLTWTVILLLFLPAMIRLLITSWRAYRLLPGNKVVPVIVWGMVMAVCVSAAMVPVRSISEEVPEYRPDVVSNAIEPMNECLWRVAGAGAEAGFPDSITALRSAEYHALQHSGNRYANRCVEVVDRIAKYPFDVQYEPRGRDSSGHARQFTLRFVEKTRASGRPRVVWIDETGLRREAVQTASGQLDSVHVLTGSSLTSLLIVQRLIDEFARSHGGEYPRKIVADFNYRNGAKPPDGVLAVPLGQCGGFDNEGASCVEQWDRAIVYAPVSDPSGRRRAYTLTMQPTSYYDNEQGQPVASRTHHRDVKGTLHSFGGWRAANGEDPPPLAEELARARESVESFFRDRARDSTNTEYWKRRQDSVWGKSGSTRSP